MNSPLVSVIVPVYNTEKYLPQCLESLIHQTIQDIEIIVVDDGSTDKTPEIIKKYAQQDKRLRAIFKGNGGCGDAYNAGLKEATGEYIGFLEADDWAEPNMFETLYRTAKNTNVDIVRASAIFRTWENKEVIQGYLPKEQCNKIITDPMRIQNFVIHHMCHWSSLYRHDFIKKNNITFPGKPKMCCPDFDWAFHCWLTAKSFYAIPKAFVHYRQDNLGAVQNSKSKHHMQAYNGHMAARKTMIKIGNKVTREHWRVKACNEVIHFLSSIDNNPTPPYEYIRGISAIFHENIQKGYFTQTDLGKDTFYRCLRIARHPILSWINMKYKLWYEKHQSDGISVYWRFFGIYKRIESPDKITTFLGGVSIATEYHIKIHYSASKRIIKTTQRSCWQTRAESTAFLINLAIKRASSEIKKDFLMKIYTADYIVEDKEYVLAYSGIGKKVILIPDFSFISWPECLISDYDTCCREIVCASQIKPKYNQLFWIGNIQTHPTRGVLLKLSQKDKRMKVISMNWNDRSAYVSLPNHCQYKYLIDVQGTGWSARTKFLMFSGRPLFLQERKWTEYWYKLIEPFVHFIPVKEDLSDLTEKLNWAEAHPKECAQIAKNAQMFAVNNLTRDAAIEYLKDVIIDYANRRQFLK